MKHISVQQMRNRWENIRCFAAVIRSDTAVRKAFVGRGIFAWWWNIVLALHGKPLRTTFSPGHRCRCVADGFRLYGWLYRVLAIVFGAAAISCWACDLIGCFWGLWLAAGGVYLWVISGLAFSGATRFHRSVGVQVWHLVAFLFFVSLFLACVLISISLQVRLAGWLPDSANVVITLVAMVFGVGSYIVELAALIVNEPFQKGGVDS